MERIAVAAALAGFDQWWMKRRVSITENPEANQGF
jgi:hypothetical protein